MNKILLVVTGWNCAAFVEKALNSISTQTVKPNSIMIIDDGSQNDNTWSKIKEWRDNNWSTACNNVAEAYRLPSNFGTAYARDKAIIYRSSWSREDNIIVLMDLDDELMPNAIETISKVYEDPNVWLTYGNYIDSDGRPCFTPENIHFETDNFRQEPWKFVHLRTFRRELYEKLNQEDLFVPNTPVYPDANMLYCLLELAGKEHIKAIPEILYKYNHDHSGTVLNRFRDQARRDEELNRVKAIKPKEKLAKL